MDTAQRCCHEIWSGFRSSPCGRPAKVKHEGRWFCGIHNPIRAAEKSAKRSAKWAAERAARESSYATAKACIALLGAGSAMCGTDNVYRVLLEQRECLLLASSCGTCACSQDEDAQSPDQTYCTAPGFYNGKAMEKTSRCHRWSAK